MTTGSPAAIQPSTDRSAAVGVILHDQHSRQRGFRPERQPVVCVGLHLAVLTEPALKLHKTPLQVHIFGDFGRRKEPHGLGDVVE